MKPNPALSNDFSTQLSQTVATLGEFYLTLIFFPFYSLRLGNKERVDDLTEKINEIEAKIKGALDPQILNDMVALLGKVAERSVEIEKSVVAWLDLVEALVQEAERAYWNQRGRGADKARLVKDALQELLSSDKNDIPRVPKALQPMVKDILVDWSIDAVVVLARENGLWQEPDAQTSSPGIFKRLLAWPRRLVKPLVNGLLNVVAWVYEKSRRRRILSPEVKRAIAAVQRDGLLLSQRDMFIGVSTGVEWVAKHRQQIVPLVQVVFTAVREADAFLDMRGPEKKAYARDLVLAVMSKMGIVSTSSPFFGLATLMVDAMIETSVHLAKKRGLFKRIKEAQVR